VTTDTAGQGMLSRTRRFSAVGRGRLGKGAILLWFAAFIALLTRAILDAETADTAGLGGALPQTSWLLFHAALGIGIASLIRRRPSPLVLASALWISAGLSFVLLLPPDGILQVSELEQNSRMLLLFVVTAVLWGYVSRAATRSFCRVFAALLLTALITIQLLFHILIVLPFLDSHYAAQRAALEDAVAIEDPNQRAFACAARGIVCWTADAPVPAAVPSSHHTDVAQIGGYLGSIPPGGYRFSPIDPVSGRNWHYSFQLFQGTGNFVGVPPHIDHGYRQAVDVGVFVMTGISGAIWLAGAVFLILLHQGEFRRRTGDRRASVAAPPR